MSNDTLSFHELVPVRPREIDGARVQTVNARMLHGALLVGRDFSNWIKGRIDRYGFAEGVDYVTAADLSSPNPASAKARSQEMVEYHLTVGMAKELAMVENNDRGRAVRRYFLECERIAHEAMGVPIDMRAIGGMVKGIVRKAIEEEVGIRLPEMVAAAIAADSRVAVESLISVRQLLDEGKAEQRGRRSLNARIGYMLRERALAGGVAAKRCAHSRVWLFPVEFARKFMREYGADLVRAHNDAKRGQGRLHLAVVRPHGSPPPAA